MNFNGIRDRLLVVIHTLDQRVVIFEAACHQLPQFLELGLIGMRRGDQRLHPALHQIELRFQHIQQ